MMLVNIPFFSEFVTFKIKICSFNQSLFRVQIDAILKVKHFFPSKIFPSYFDPYDITPFVYTKCEIYFFLTEAHCHLIFGFYFGTAENSIK
jgi:hypothetical protein